MVIVEGHALSVKCSSDTKSILRYMFQNDLRFIELKKYGVILNPSWLFKFSLNYTLKNLEITSDVIKYGYRSHYVDYLDKTIKSNIRY